MIVVTRFLSLCAVLLAIPAVAIAQPTSLPDLNPTAILFNSADLVPGRAVFFDSGVQNSGSQGTGVFNIRWFIDGVSVGYGSHAGVPANSTVLDGNSQLAPPWVATAGTHTIEFAVDVDNHVLESNESNNSRSVTVTVNASSPPPPPPAPEPPPPPTTPPQCISKLTVQRVWTRDAAGTDKATFAPGETIQFAAQLNNSYGGALLAANGTQLTINTSFHNDTRPVDIPPGISTSTWNATAPSTESSYTVTVKAYDHFCGTFREGSATFTVRANPPPPTTPPPPAPPPPTTPPAPPPVATVTLEQTLTLNDVDRGQTQFRPGEVIKYAALVNNTGSSTVTAKFDFRASGPPEIFSWIGDVSIPPGGGGFHLPAIVPTDAPGGNYTLRVTMTHNGQTSIKESSFTVTPQAAPSPPTTPPTTPTPIPTPTPTPPTTPAPLSTEPQGNAPYLIILVHGCCTDAEKVSEWHTLGNEIYDKIEKKQHWEIVVWDWHGSTPPPPGVIDQVGFKIYADIAYNAAENEGLFLAHAVNQHPIYEYIHFIAHSAGGKLIHEAAKSLSVLKKQKNAERPFIHLTFLDAYTPNKGDKKGARSYGSLPNDYLKHYSEHYVHRSRNLVCLSLGIASTDAILEQAFNFDITKWRANDLEKLQLDCGHQWPRTWYEKSVTSGRFEYGYPLSFEGGWGNSKYKGLAKKEYLLAKKEYPKGKQCLLTRAKGKCVAK